jgi:hypothetical protein
VCSFSTDLQCRPQYRVGGASNLNAAAFEHAVNFAIPDAERTNPNVVAGADGTMCVDRKP